MPVTFWTAVSIFSFSSWLFTVPESVALPLSIFTRIVGSKAATLVSARSSELTFCPMA
jgi:hypothetical protein